MNLTPFTVVALFTATLIAVQNLLRYVRAKDLNGTLGILLACTAGWVVVVLAAHSSVLATFHLIDGGPALGALNWADLLMVGVAVGSLGTVTVDGLASLDNTRTAAKPKLIESPPAP